MLQARSEKRTLRAFSLSSVKHSEPENFISSRGKIKKKASNLLAFFLVERIRLGVRGFIIGGIGGVWKDSEMRGGFPRISDRGEVFDKLCYASPSDEYGGAFCPPFDDNVNGLRVVSSSPP